jgi:hypothetical protein
MSLISPLEHKEDILEKGYRCISHYWGNAKPFRWIDHGIAGVNWGVDVREEKRGRVIEVFKYHKGYFWMDVFCTNQDTNDKALDIMGVIYKNCKECICLLDYKCEIEEYESEKEILYLLINIMYKLGHFKYCFKFNMFVVYLSQKFKGKKTLKISDYELTYMNKAYEKLLDEEQVMCRDVISTGKLERYISSINKCQWFHRVWTLQETVLSPKVGFVSEISGNHEYEPIDEHVFIRNSNVNFISFKDGENPNSNDIVDILSYIVTTIFKDMNKGELLRYISTSERKCTSDPDYVYGISGILGVSIPDKLTLEEGISYMYAELQKQGIYVLGWENVNLKPVCLSELYREMEFVSEIYTFRKFESDTAECINLGYHKYSTPKFLHIPIENTSRFYFGCVTDKGCIIAIKHLNLNRQDHVEVMRLSGKIRVKDDMRIKYIVDFVDKKPVFIGFFQFGDFSTSLWEKIYLFVGSIMGTL